MKKQVAYLQKLFYELWNDFGSVYLIVGYSDRTSIGKRGFTDEEKERGLVLVFNDKTNNKLEWDPEGNLSCVLAFGASKEELFIHHQDLRGIFSPEAGVQFMWSDGKGAEEPAPAPAGQDRDAGPGEGKQVVSLSEFRKQRPKGKPHP